MRQVVYFPIFHTEKDLGEMAPAVRAFAARRVGMEHWDRAMAAVDRFWQSVRDQITKLALDWSRVRLYQDGLAVCDREVEIAQDLARAGNPNHILLVDLLRQGATIMGTESPPLLIEEYQRVRKILSEANADAAAMPDGQVEVGRVLLEKRDQFIAGRINSTLQPGETGILFLGMLHAVERWLDPDIRVTYPLFPPLHALVSDKADTCATEGKVHMAKKQGNDTQAGGFDLGFGKLVKGFGDLLEKLGEMAEKGQEWKKSVEFGSTSSGKPFKGVYGFNVRFGLGGDDDVKVEPFGNIRKDTATGKAVVEEVREPMVDVFEEADGVLIVAEMPGVGLDDVKVELRGDVLMIEAERGDKKYRKEVLLPGVFDAATLATASNNGVVEIRIKK